MPDLKQTRKHLTIAVVSLAVVNVLAIAMLVTPLAGMQEVRQQQLSRLWANLKSRESAPWRGMETKIPLAQKDIDKFYQERFPAQESAISADLGKLAADSAVRISAIKYDVKDAPVEGLQRVEIDAELSGDYVPLMKFTNALERSQLFFIVDDVQLGGEQSGAVKLHMKAETYLRVS
jgi:hypothetical protein